MRQLQSSAICLGPCGLMDKAPASGAGDSAFESRLGQCSFFCVLRTWADVARRPRPPCEVSHRSVQFGGVGGRRRGGMRCFSANCQKKSLARAKYLMHLPTLTREARPRMTSQGGGAPGHVDGTGSGTRHWKPAPEGNTFMHEASHPASPPRRRPESDAFLRPLRRPPCRPHPRVVSTWHRRCATASAYRSLWSGGRTPRVRARRRR